MNRSVLGVELSPAGPVQAPPARDPYRAVTAAMFAAALIGSAALAFGGRQLGTPVLFGLAIALGIAAGMLGGVLLEQRNIERRKRAAAGEPEAEVDFAPESAESATKSALARLVRAIAPVRNRLARLPWLEIVRNGVAVAGLAAVGLTLAHKQPLQPPANWIVGVAAGACLLGTVLAAIAARYLGLEAAKFPQAASFCRGARVLAWLFVLAAAAVGCTWLKFPAAATTLQYIILAVVVAACTGWLRARRRIEAAGEVFPIQIGVFTLLGSRANALASVLDTAERQLGIDLRSTWALTVVRRSLEPVAVSLLLLGWLSTSSTVIGIDEQGLVERLGIPVAGAPLAPGLHLHWPWPIDQVTRYPVERVQLLDVGHEGQEKEGPENVLWAVEHAPNEYTLVLGDGRDLITVDAAVNYIIVNAHDWRYRCQNPADALKALAYRAVMRNTVNKTLSDAMSENMTVVARTIRDMVQREADGLGLGVRIVGFTIGGMHPPVPVAADYEAVVSAQLGMQTSVANAESFHNRTVPAAEASVLTDENTARADGANALAQAAGDAWSFRTLEAQYRAAPEEYVFRRRLETLEKGLASRRYTIIDSRIQRDGGELWIVP